VRDISDKMLAEASFHCAHENSTVKTGNANNNASKANTQRNNKRELKTMGHCR
jgi:1,2-phenylacetyl-CoA epoxidase catalytic subunit